MDRLATEAELSPWRPGGDRNPDTSILGVLRWYGRLNRIHARGESRGTESARDAADATLTAALEERPAAVDLVRPLSDGQTHLTVHPKAFSVLVRLTEVGRRIGELAAVRLARSRATDVDAPRHVQMADEGLDYFYRLYAWVVTHPGPGLPYGWADLEPTPPEWTRGLDARDFLSLIGAHIALDVLPFKALEILTHPDGSHEGGPRPTWAQWFASLAPDGQADTLTLMRGAGFMRLLATHALAADRQRQAMKQAQAAGAN
jgi:hypothetical protein